MRHLKLDVPVERREETLQKWGLFASRDYLQVFLLSRTEWELLTDKGTKVLVDLLNEELTIVGHWREVTYEHAVKDMQQWCAMVWARDEQNRVSWGKHYEQRRIKLLHEERERRARGIIDKR